MYRYLIFLASGLFVLSAKAQVVTLDYYFNHETHKGKSGKPERFHYLWDETAGTGYSNWGNVFKKYGFQLRSLDAEPDADSLKGTDIYIIVDPDNRKENPDPHFIMPKHIDAIAGWVKRGGVLVMLANDSANVELKYFNRLAGVFGMHFNNDLQNHFVSDADFPKGGMATDSSPVFKTAKKVFMKDVCSIELSEKAEPLLKNSNGATVMAMTKYGRGTVVAIGDPWLYNEYNNGRLPAIYENSKGADDITGWLKEQIPKK